MQIGIKKLEFEFNNSANALVPSLEEMLGYVTGNIPVSVGTDDILFKCKVIITELLTNAIKHAGNTGAIFEIWNEERDLIIQKTDKGPPLYLVDAGSSDKDITTGRRLISADPLNSLFAVWEDENRIRFISEEGSIEDFLSVEQVMEHFGLLIIARSSDEFTYTCDKKNNLNVFRVKIII